MGGDGASPGVLGALIVGSLFRTIVFAMDDYWPEGRVIEFLIYAISERYIKICGGASATSC